MAGTSTQRLLLEFLAQHAWQERDLIQRLFPAGEAYHRQAKQEVFEPLQEQGLIKHEILHPAGGNRGRTEVWWMLTMRGMGSRHEGRAKTERTSG